MSGKKCMSFCVVVDVFFHSVCPWTMCDKARCHGNTAVKDSTDRVALGRESTLGLGGALWTFSVEVTYHKAFYLVGVQNKKLIWLCTKCSVFLESSRSQLYPVGGINLAIILTDVNRKQWKAVSSPSSYGQWNGKMNV